jgi:hypothetical protein
MLTKPNAGKDVEQHSSHSSLVGMPSGTMIQKDNLAVTDSISFPNNSGIILPDICPMSCTEMFTAALSAIAKKLEGTEMSFNR